MLKNRAAIQIHLEEEEKTQETIAEFQTCDVP